jgi:hypothetical protein
VIDQHSQSDTAVMATAVASLAKAMGELADVIRTSGSVLAEALRETAMMADGFESIPCGQAMPDAVASSEDIQGGAGTVLPIVTNPRRGATETPMAETAPCPPGGCGCDQLEFGCGRHVGRDTTDVDGVQAVAR